MSTPSFKDMPLWQRAMGLVSDIYGLTAQLPATERLGLSSNLQQAAVAVPALLAAGSKAGRTGFVAACLSARQRTAEVETLLLIIQQAYPQLPIDDQLAEAADIQIGLTTMARRLQQKPAPRTV